MKRRLKKWRRPEASILRWQVFVSSQWKTHIETLRRQPDGRQLRELKTLREEHSHVVIFPIDHRPHLACSFCPTQYSQILEKTFPDPAVFWCRDVASHVLSQQLQRAALHHVPPAYHWAISTRLAIPTGVLLFWVPDAFGLARLRLHLVSTGKLIQASEVSYSWTCSAVLAEIFGVYMMITISLLPCYVMEKDGRLSRLRSRPTCSSVVGNA